MTDSEVSNFLVELGLTEYEAKTLGTLFHVRESEAPEISRLAQVPKTRVYDVLERLMEKQLIIEISGRPKKYRVADPENVFTTLIEKKRTEIKNLEERADALKNQIISKNGFSKKGERVMKVKDKSDFYRIVAQEIGKATKSVHGFSDITHDHHHLSAAIKDAVKRDIEVKLISRIAESGQEIANSYLNQGVSIKDCAHNFHAFVIDGNRVVLGLSDFNESKPEYHFTIWDDNKPMANALMLYFNQCWESGNAAKCEN